MRYLLLFLISFPIYAEEEWYVPDYTVGQSAGYVGLLAGGVGYQVNDRHSVDLLLGYTPQIVAGEESVWSLAIKNSLRIAYPIYVGLNILYAFDEEDDSGTFVELPSKYPRRYYASTAIRTALYLGMDVVYEGHLFYFEVTSLDLYMETYLRSDLELDLKEVSTWSIGIKRPL